MKHNIKHRVLGLLATGLTLAVEAAFLYLLIRTSLLTPQILLLCGVALSLLTILVFVLTKDSRKRIRTVLGSLLALFAIAAQAIGGYYVHTGITALEQITVPKVEYAEVGVFVKADDPAMQLSDAAQYTFGILEVQDREATDSALEQLAEEFGSAASTKEYAGLTDLIDALFESNEVSAILLNKGFLDIFDELEGYETVSEQLRELHQIQSEIAVSPTEPKPEPEISLEDPTFTVYISGIDCYGSISRRSRSDVNIIATVNVETGQVLLVSTPRDYYVPLSISNGVPDKLTHAGIYGIQVSKDTLAALYGIEIDYYFRVNFDGFKHIIDALGGVTVNSVHAFESAGYTFSQGINTLDGDAALVFARARYTLPGGDRARGKNQMAVITAVINKAMSPALLKNFKATLDGMAGSFETDMPYEKIAALVQHQLQNGTSWNVTSYSADGTGDTQIPYSMNLYAYVMVPDQSTVDHAKELMTQVENGSIPTP